MRKLPKWPGWNGNKPIKKVEARMKCFLPGGCGNPDGCFDDGECYWKGFHDRHEAQRNSAELNKIPDDQVLAFGCDLEAHGNPRCEEWCHLVCCPFALKETVSSDTGHLSATTHET